MTVLTFSHTKLSTAKLEEVMKTFGDFPSWTLLAILLGTPLLVSSQLRLATNGYYYHCKPHDCMNMHTHIHWPVTYSLQTSEQGLDAYFIGASPLSDCCWHQLAFFDPNPDYGDHGIPRHGGHDCKSIKHTE